MIKMNFKHLSLSFVTRHCHVNFSLSFRRKRKSLSFGNRKNFGKFPNSACVASPKIERNAKRRFDRRHVAVGAVKGEDAKMIGERRGP